jgi:hypothetical protein
MFTDITPDMDYVDTDFGIPWQPWQFKWWSMMNMVLKVDIKQLSGFKSLNELYQFVEEQK